MLFRMVKLRGSCASAWRNARERGVRIAELAERRAEIAEGGGEGRHQIGGALERVARARHVVVDEPQLAALVVHRFPVGRERGGAIERVARAARRRALSRQALASASCATVARRIAARPPRGTDAGARSGSLDGERAARAASTTKDTEDTEARGH